MRLKVFEQGDVTPPHREHESRLCLCSHDDENLLLWSRSSCQQTHPLFWSARVHCAPGAGAGRSDPVRALCGSTQIREELFTRDCGVLSFTAAHFPSFHHAVLYPTLPWLFPWGLPKNIWIFGKYYKCIQINGRIYFNKLSARYGLCPSQQTVTSYCICNTVCGLYTGLLLCTVTHCWKKQIIFYEKIILNKNSAEFHMKCRNKMETGNLLVLHTSSSPTGTLQN